MNGASSPGVAIAKQYDRDTKIAYVEQIRTGKLREIKAARELGVYKSRIHIWRKKCSGDVNDHLRILIFGHENSPCELK